MISSMGAADPRRARRRCGPISRPRREADAALAASDLDWTIVRPGGAHRRARDGARRGGAARSAGAGRSRATTSRPCWSPASTSRAPCARPSSCCRARRRSRRRWPRSRPLRAGAAARTASQGGGEPPASRSCAELLRFVYGRTQGEAVRICPRAEGHARVADCSPSAMLLQEPVASVSRGARIRATRARLCADSAGAGERAAVRRRPLVQARSCSWSCASRTSCSSNGPSCASPRASTCSRARPARARPCSPTRSTCCWAAARGRGSCARARPRPTWRASSSCPTALRGELGERLPADAEEVVLARRVSAEGRTRAYLCGRSAAVGDLRDVAVALLSFYGQHEHRKLMLASVAARDPRRLLRRGAPGARARRSRRPTRGCASSRRRWPSCASAPAPASASSTCSRSSCAEIEAADPSEAEEAELRARARAPAPPRGAARRGAGRGAGGRARRRGRGSRRCWPPAAPGSTASAGVDPGSTRWPSAGARWPTRPTTSPASCCATPRGSRASPARSRPPRSAWPCSTAWSASTAARSPPCSRTPSAAARGATSSPAPRSRWSEATAELEAARAEQATARGALRAARAKAAPRLASAVRERLAELAMEGASFEIALQRARAGPDGRRRRRVPHRPQRRRPRRPAARDRLGRRALAGDARAHGRRQRRLRGHARLRRGRRRHRRPHGARGRLAAARAGRGPPGPVHHAPAADRLARRAPLLDRQGQRRRAGAHDGPRAGAGEVVGRARADARRRRRRRRRPPPRAELLAAA